MKEYLKAQNKTNETILENAYSPDELDRFSKSDYRWADNKTKPFRHKIAKKGEIYQFEFGKNYIPEMSYEHRGLVIGVKQKLLYVLPIFSYDPLKHPDVYHPINHSDSKSNMFLLKASEFSFIIHDSVLKLNDIRTVSVNRILYQQSGRIPPSSDTYKQIAVSLNEQLKEAINQNNILEAENEQLKAELKILQNQIPSPQTS